MTAALLVIAQQYSTVTFVSLSFHFCKEKLGARVIYIIISKF
jgi:uncharacterized membrane protein